MHATQIEFDAGGVHAEIFRAKHVLAAACRAERVADDVQTAPESDSKFGAKRIIQIQHRRRETGSEEQLFLGCRVCRHAAVVLEVVARQVGENSDIKSRSVHPPLIEPDR